jgi:hypothetical protein
MKYRVRIDMSFDSKAEALSLMNYAKKAAGSAVSINEGNRNEEISFCTLELCGHDEDPPVPCKVITYWKVGKGEVI